MRFAWPRPASSPQADCRSHYYSLRSREVGRHSLSLGRRQDDRKGESYVPGVAG